MKKIKNYILTIFVVILSIFCLSSCEHNRNYENYTPQEGSIFVCVESYIDPYLGDVKILVDKETKVMYMYYWERGNEYHFSSSITVLYDSDGKPKKYNGVITN